ncbi:UNVERIFIED_CONTAM: hypothetical protein NCL1_32694 [Trichonephila clavipes]
MRTGRKTEDTESIKLNRLSNTATILLIADKFSRNKYQSALEYLSSKTVLFVIKKQGLCDVTEESENERENESSPFTKDKV